MLITITDDQFSDLFVGQFSKDPLHFIPAIRISLDSVETNSGFYKKLLNMYKEMLVRPLERVYEQLRNGTLAGASAAAELSTVVNYIYLIMLCIQKRTQAYQKYRLYYWFDYILIMFSDKIYKNLLSKITI